MAVVLGRAVARDRLEHRVAREHREPEREVRAHVVEAVPPHDARELAHRDPLAEEPDLADDRRRREHVHVFHRSLGLEPELSARAALVALIIYCE